MADERSTGFAELKAVALHILQGQPRHPSATHATHQPGSEPMANRDARKDPPPRDPNDGTVDRDTRPTSPGAEAQAAASGPAPAAADTASDPAATGPAGSREATQDDDIASERRDDYGAGVQPHHGKGDADDGAWPPADWDENGNASRHGQSREGRGPGGYEDRSRELRDFGPGPKGSSGEAWRTYEHHADDTAGQEDRPDPDGGDGTDARTAHDHRRKPG